MTDDPSASRALIAAITAAFDGVSREDGVTLHEADVIDNYGTDEERAAARNRDTEGRWQDVPDESINECYSGLPHLCSRGLRYYIPAFMVWTLRHYRNCSTPGPDYTVNALHPRFGTANFHAFTPEQRRAVCRFLRYLAAGVGGPDVDYVTAREAVEQYWGRFCPAKQ